MTLQEPIPMVQIFSLSLSLSLSLSQITDLIILAHRVHKTRKEKLELAMHNPSLPYQEKQRSDSEQHNHMKLMIDCILVCDLHALIDNLLKSLKF
jgi:hypothetical protein